MRRLPLLSRLWLLEPDAALLEAAAGEFALPADDPALIAQNYADVFLLNVFPYGTVFTDDDGEMNGAGARRAAELYKSWGYAPSALGATGAADHVGLCLGFLDFLEIAMRITPNGAQRSALSGQEPQGSGGGARSLADAALEFVRDLALWAPACCIATEREPTALPFYRELGRLTRDAVLSSELVARAYESSGAAHGQGSASGEPNGEYDPSEAGARELLDFFLAPSRCGAFISRSCMGRLARELGVRLPFGPRRQVGMALLVSAGESGQVELLFSLLAREISAWEGEYARMHAELAHWRNCAEHWIYRANTALGRLDALIRLARTQPVGGLAELSE